jgi:hypothetical protein
VRINADGQLGTGNAPSGRGPMKATVKRLEAELKRQQHQIDRLRERVKRG